MLNGAQIGTQHDRDKDVIIKRRLPNRHKVRSDTK
jgi:hypothetical protein